MPSKNEIERMQRELDDSKRLLILQCEAIIPPESRECRECWQTWADVLLTTDTYAAECAFDQLREALGRHHAWLLDHKPIITA